MIRAILPPKLIMSDAKYHFIMDLYPNSFPVAKTLDYAEIEIAEKKFFEAIDGRNYYILQPKGEPLLDAKTIIFELMESCVNATYCHVTMPWYIKGDLTLLDILVPDGIRFRTNEDGTIRKFSEWTDTTKNPLINDGTIVVLGTNLGGTELSYQEALTLKNAGLNLITELEFQKLQPKSPGNEPTA